MATTPAKKKHAWMHLTEHHLPEMKGLELGKRYKIEAEIEPHELATGENEYGSVLGAGPDGKPVKEPMRGRFKVHSIKISHKHESARHGAHKGKEKESMGKKDSAAEESHESAAERRREGDVPTKKGKKSGKAHGRY